jgi:RecJ-like exonuclease
VSSQKPLGRKCSWCGGAGRIKGGAFCRKCGGTGRTAPRNPYVGKKLRYDSSVPVEPPPIERSKNTEGQHAAPCTKEAT